jgi:DNA-binding transcriptional LysR family regulator
LVRGESFALTPAPTFQVNGADAMATAVSKGMGIALLQTDTVVNRISNGDLVWIMPEYTAQPMNIYALYSSREYIDAKVRTWVDFLREQLPDTLAAVQAALRHFAYV